MDTGGWLGTLASKVVGALAGAAKDEAERTAVRRETSQFHGNGVASVNVESASGNVSFTGKPGQADLRVCAQTRVRGQTLEAAEAFLPHVVVRAEVLEGCLRVSEEHPPPPPGIDVAVDFELEGPCEVSTTATAYNGDVAVRNCACAWVQATGSNGNVHVQGASKKVQARTQNGNVSAEVVNVTAGGLFATTNGNIDLILTPELGEIEAVSNNGNVGVVLPLTFAGWLHAGSSNGQVHVTDRLGALRKTSRDRSTPGNVLEGTLGPPAADGGSAARLRANTNNGNVTVDHQ